jgi:hypothetical protein
MHRISEIIGVASLVSGFPLACRSLLEIVSSLQARKQVSVVAPETKCGDRENGSPNTDYLVAGSLLTPPSKLALLSQSAIPHVRGRVAENPNCPVALLSWLAQDSNPEVRLSVAYNPKAPAILLDWLVNDECPDVLFALAEDHNLAAPLLAKLSHNDNPYIAERAKQTLERLPLSEKVSWLDSSAFLEWKTMDVLCHHR